MIEYDEEGVIPPEEFERIISQLPAEDAERMRQQRERLFEGLAHQAKVGIICRNLSHSVGGHVLTE